MSFEPYNSSEIAAGQPTKQELFLKLKENFDDHEERIQAAGAASGSKPPIEFGVFGLLNPPMAVTGILTTRIPYNISLLACRLLVVTAGSAGTLEIDIEYKRGAGAWTSILNAPISSTYTDGDYFLVTGDLSISSLVTGDLLRLNINGIQTSMEDFLVFIENAGA